MVSNLCNIDARLWQEGDRVFFVARRRVQLVDAAARDPQRRPQMDLAALPSDLRIFCLDDSAIARRTLAHAFQQHIPNSVVRTFGQSPSEVVCCSHQSSLLRELVGPGQGGVIPEPRLPEFLLDNSASPGVGGGGGG